MQFCLTLCSFSLLTHITHLIIDTHTHTHTDQGLQKCQAVSTINAFYYKESKLQSNVGYDTKQSGTVEMSQFTLQVGTAGCFITLVLNNSSLLGCDVVLMVVAQLLEGKYSPLRIPWTIHSRNLEDNGDTFRQISGNHPFNDTAS